MRLIFASKNRGKIKEVIKIFSSLPFEITSLLDLNDKINIEETEITFKGNAEKKAKEIFSMYKIPVIADDSGIEVKQLDGKPGVLSARYAGENSTDKENNQKLINELRNFPEPHPAKYVCCAAFYNGEIFISEFGEIKGNIIKEGRGTNGFGYDPHFIPEGYNITMAEMLSEEKNRISHRAIAFNKLKEKLKEIYE